MKTTKGSSAITTLVVIIVILLALLAYLYLRPASVPAAPQTTDNQTASQSTTTPAPTQTTQSPTTSNTKSVTKPAALATTTSSQSLTYSGRTDSGLTFTLSYPSSWDYYKFSCNTDGVAFWPKTVIPNFSNGEVCGANSAINNAPVVAYAVSDVDLRLNNPTYQNIYNQMKSSLHEQASTGPCGLQVTSPAVNSYVTFPLTISGVIDNTDPSCNWTMFEGYAGTVELSYFTPSQGWRVIQGSGNSVRPVDWTAKKTTFSVTLTFNNANVGLYSNTQMKATFTPDNPSGKADSRSVDFPFILK